MPEKIRREKILVIDDFPLNLNVIGAHLTIMQSRMKRHHLLMKSQKLEVNLEAEPFTTLLIDYTMPGVDGALLQKFFAMMIVIKICVCVLHRLQGIICKIFSGYGVDYS